jgi:hypothetical protein
MQILKPLSLSVLLAVAAINTPVCGTVNPVTVNYSETPAKTIILKHPAANNAAAFFSGNTAFMFEVFKPGSKEELNRMVKLLAADANVQSCNEGQQTGDYQAITLVLKSAKDKAWFASLFKKAGLTTIKINNNPVVDVDKM